jgi:drug/metabolite transporter (DMT)-like permease
MQATLIGFSAIVMWSMLALMTALSGSVPPFQLATMCFLVATIIGLVAQLSRPGSVRRMIQPWPVWLLGTTGLFGYHFFYFTALRNAPAVEAGLIAYLWPLFIVVGSALLPGERLGWHHIAGTLAGLAGTVLIVTGKGLNFEPQFAFGYAAALVCAFIWSSYSLLSRRFGAVPTDAVTGFCAATMVLSLVSHLIFERTIWPAGAGQWLAVLGLGLMPVGGAFYVWDYGVKRGNIQILGALSYAAPLLSTVILVAAGLAQPSWRIAAACLLITGGAALAAKELLRRQPA